MHLFTFLLLVGTITVFAISETHAEDAPKMTAVPAEDAARYELDCEIYKKHLEDKGSRFLPPQRFPTRRSSARNKVATAGSDGASQRSR